MSSKRGTLLGRAELRRSYDYREKNTESRDGRDGVKVPPQEGRPQAGLTKDVPIWPKDLKATFKTYDYFKQKSGFPASPEVSVVLATLVPYIHLPTRGCLEWQLTLEWQMLPSPPPSPTQFC